MKPLTTMSMALALGLADPVAHAADDLPIFVGKPAPGLQLSVSDFETSAPLTGRVASTPKSAQVPESQVTLRRSARAGQPDALTSWSGAWYAALRVEAARPVDLRPYLEQGTLEFDVNVAEMARGGLFVAIGCGKDCHRKVNYVLPSRALQGQGWQHLAFPLRCFARDGDDFSAIPQPFILDGSGWGDVSIANVRFRRRASPGQALAACPDYRTESVTPSPLNQVWALDWWMGRHEQKLQAVRDARAAGKAIELLFVGDSITQGWEDAGRKVWDAHYAPHHALDLGFGGDHTENVLWRLQHGEVDGLAPKVAVVMIGTNNSGDRAEDPYTTALGVRRIVAELRERLPRTRILLLAVFPRDESPQGFLRRLNDRVNGLISAVADGDRVSFLDINDALLNPDGTLSKAVMPDLLHPNERGYQLWADAMAPALNRLLAAPPLP